MSLAPVYYITNYATKDDVSAEQLIAKAALLKQSIEKSMTTETPTPSDLRLRERYVQIRTAMLQHPRMRPRDQQCSGCLHASAVTNLLHR
jgi:hypothetical protein